MALTYSNGMARGSEAPAFSLPATDGKTYSLDSFSEAKALVVVFTCNHCPYAQAYEDRFVALQRDYAERGVRLVAINPNDAARYPDDSFEAMQVRAREKGYNFPYLRDRSQEVARAYQAACTPDIYVFDADRKLFCQTRVDDNWQNPEGVTRRDLRDVLDALLSGKDLPFEPVYPMGCSIKWLESQAGQSVP